MNGTLEDMRMVIGTAKALTYMPMEIGMSGNSRITKNKATVLSYGPMERSTTGKSRMTIDGMASFTALMAPLKEHIPTVNGLPNNQPDIAAERFTVLVGCWE